MDCGITPSDPGWEGPCKLPGAKLADPFPGWRYLYALAMDPSTQILEEPEGC